MPQSEYAWDSIENPPVIKIHSLNKHEIITEYIKVYLDKLYQAAHSSFKVAIVDGFAGGGIYKKADGTGLAYGSPIKIMQAVNESQQLLPEKYKKNVHIDARYYFVEEKIKAFNTLGAVLDRLELTPFANPDSKVIHGSIDNYYDGIIDSIMSQGTAHRAIFILDQYGYSDVPMLKIQQIFKRLPKAEVILTFAIDWLIDYLSTKPEAIEKTRKTLRSLGLSDRLDEIIDLRSKKGARFLIQDILSEELAQKCGSRFFTRYFIRADGKGANISHRDLWIVHMSQHKIARDEMVKIHWNSANSISIHSGYEGIDPHGMARMGYTTRADERLGQINLGFNFKDDRKLAVDALLKQIPDIICDMSRNGPFTLDQLMEKFVNHTVSSSEIVKEVLNYLIKSKDITVKCPKTGATKRKGNTIGWGDYIKYNQQTFLFPHV